MSRAVNAVVVGVALFIVLAGVVWFVAVGRETDKIDVEWTGRFEGADESTTHLTLEITFTNRYNAEVRLTGLQYTYVVNGEELAHDTSRQGGKIEPHGRLVVRVPADFSTDSIPAWFAYHVDHGEESRVGLEGTANFMLGSRNLTVHIADTHRWSTRLGEALQDVDDCTAGSADVCVAGVNADWSASADEATLRLEVTLHNGADSKVSIKNATASLLLGGVAVGTDSQAGDEIDKGGDATLTLLLPIESSRLVEWWGSHVETCESSPAALQVSFEGKGPLPTTSSSPPANSSSPSSTSSSPPPASSNSSSSSNGNPSSSSNSTAATTYRERFGWSLAVVGDPDFPLGEFETGFACSHR